MASSPALTVMIAAVRKAARGVQRDFGELQNLQVSVKGPGDYVTAADKRCEKVLREELAKARPTYGFLMEESGEEKGSDPDHRFIADPIDGTTNFMRAIPYFAISVALERKGELIAAVTYNPISDELFHGEKGQGAFLNNKRLRVGARTDLTEAVVCTGIPHRGRPGHAENRAEIAALQAKSIGIRRFGSAALELGYVAAGRLDAFWERGLAPWDVAAGMLFVREASGVCTTIEGDGDPLHAKSIVAANADIMVQIKKELAAAARSV
ncbi:MAG: inositol monophosphatase family protein [Aestuariivirga sp.]